MYELKNLKQKFMNYDNSFHKVSMEYCRQSIHIKSLGTKSILPLKFGLPKVKWKRRKTFPCKLA